MHHVDGIINLAGGGEAVQQVKRVVQNVAHHATPETEPHGIVHVMLKLDPWDGWGILGLTLLGGATLLWWHTKKYVHAWVGAVVEKRMKAKKD